MLVKPAVLLASLLMLAGCRASPAPAEERPDAAHNAMAAATGVTRADGGKGLLEHRIVPLKPMTGDVELLYGDPDVAGQPFVMRIRELPGAKVPPHSHQVDEHITVVQGTWYFALGNEFKREALQELKAGSYAFAPKGSTMFGFSPDGAVVQVHGVGPFQIHWKGGLHTLDDADAKTTFRLAKGTRVSSERGAARIVQGYASGEIVQYELEGADGARFMADEGAVTPQ
jgi:quercetin dioxygenase-like cupin family protein